MIVLKNATAVQFEPAQVRTGVEIAIDQDVIVAVGQGLTTQYPHAEVRDMHDKLVMPGMVCAHNHFYSGLSRGIMADIKPSPDFISTLKNLWWRVDRALDEDSLYYSGLVCALDAIRCGCTAVIDHHASPNLISGSLDILREGFMQAGLRGMTCFETTNRNGGLDEIAKGVEENIRFAQKIDADRRRGQVPDLMEAHIGAHAAFTLSDDGLMMLSEAVKATGRGLHIHAAEDDYDVSFSHDHYGQDIIERLANYDLINNRTVVAHGVGLSEMEIDLINKQQAFLVHNARSNMNNHVGYNQSLSQFDHVALGTDGIGSDMLEELKFAFFKHRDAGGHLWPDNFLKYLWNGNVILGRNFGARFGCLEPGYKADLTVLDYASPTPLLADNLPGHVAFGFHAGLVSDVMVNGRFVYENGAFPFDVAPIYAKSRQAAQRLWARMDQLD